MLAGYFPKRPPKSTALYRPFLTVAKRPYLFVTARKKPVALQQKRIVVIARNPKKPVRNLKYRTYFLYRSGA